MKKSLAILAAATALTTASASDSFAKDFEGFYAGLGIGLTSMKGEAKATSTNAKADLGSSGLAGSIFGGYGKMTSDKFYVGGELDIGLDSGTSTSSNGNTSGAYFKASRGLLYSAFVRGGVIVAPKTLAFLKLGVRYSKFRLSASDGTGFEKKEKGKYAFVPGVGIETMVSDKISVRADYTYAFFSEIKSDEGKFTPRVSTFLVGAAYKF
ncbi:MAG: porin family protein [Alphaproteobacteria bacterium]|jgi:outer membrane immunogenic protein|nr:porin family protein [Alphaproteobacteria bacterium]MBT5390305.1 porin family protein [Alphaproteobacteria bacterium]MBT5540295.1 porin family protein [Alphaproteobacteria bacterium]